MMPLYDYILLAAGWLAWVVPFFFGTRSSRAPLQLDRRARVGIIIQMAAYALLWQGHFWLRSPASWQTALSALLFAGASVLSWTGKRALGRHWRVDAGLDADHALVRGGAYRVVRHPIYASMLCLLLGTGLLLAPWPLLLVCVVLAVIGTEVRVRVEDGLLASRFGEEFRAYQREVAAYVPFIR
jgi:protein-S-isoprenylcysteine O-methyltransferase Ste14